MKATSSLIRGYTIFVAAAGFLFGQLFFGDLDWAATVAGVSGLGAGILGLWDSDPTRARSILVIAVCVAGLFGVGCDAYDYYAHHRFRGNYYAWFLIGPFCVCLLMIMSLTIRNMPSSNLLESDA